MIAGTTTLEAVVKTPGGEVVATLPTQTLQLQAAESESTTFHWTVFGCDPGTHLFKVMATPAGHATRSFTRVVDVEAAERVRQRLVRAKH